MTDRGVAKYLEATILFPTYSHQLNCFISVFNNHDILNECSFSLLTRSVAKTLLCFFSPNIFRFRCLLFVLSIFPLPCLASLFQWRIYMLVVLKLRCLTLFISIWQSDEINKCLLWINLFAVEFFLLFIRGCAILLLAIIKKVEYVSYFSSN